MSSNNYDYLPKNNLQYFLNKLKAKFLGKDALDDTSTSASTLWSSNKVSAELDKKAKKEFTGTKDEWNALTSAQKAVYDGCIVNLIDDYDVQVKIDDTTPALNKVYSSQKTQNELDNKLSYADNSILGAKNLLLNNATTQEINGVTFTVNSDGSVTVNGTATAYTQFDFADNLFMKAGTYVLGGCPDGGSASTYTLWFRNTIVTIGYTDYGTPIPFTVSTEENYKASIIVYIGATVSNKTFYPMIRLATDTDDTYVPYAMTNRQLTQAMPIWTSGVQALTGATSCTITDNAISSSSVLEVFYENTSGTDPVAKVTGVSGTTATIGFKALAEDTTFYLRVTNL